MYTGRTVRQWSFTLALALLVAVTPVIGVVCELDCDTPPAKSAPCHDASVPRDGSAVRGTSHGCDHDHMEGSPALLTNRSGRDSVVVSAAAPPLMLVRAFLPEPQMTALPAMHGPPGSSARSTTSLTTALRI